MTEGCHSLRNRNVPIGLNQRSRMQQSELNVVFPRRSTYKRIMRPIFMYISAAFCNISQANSGWEGETRAIHSILSDSGVIPLQILHHQSWFSGGRSHRFKIQAQLKWLQWKPKLMKMMKMKKNISQVNVSATQDSIDRDTMIMVMMTILMMIMIKQMMTMTMITNFLYPHPNFKI